MTKLYPYQETGARWLADRKYALLADEMGLGKSAQAIRACDHLFHEKVLVVCPAAARENWKAEFRKFSLTGIVPEVVSYERAAKGVEGAFDALICDEAHYVKNGKAKRTKAIFDKKTGLSRRAQNVWLLTGTPMPNDARDLWPMMHHLFGCDMNLWRFTRAFCKGYENGFGAYVVTGVKNETRLKSILDPVMLRRRASEVLDLPPLTFSSSALDVRVSRELAALEDEIGPDILLALAEGDGEAMRRLKAQSPHVAQLRRLTGLIKAPAIAERIKEALSHELKNVGIFCLHRDVISYIEDALKDFGVVTVQGKNSHKAGEAVEKFQRGDARVFIGQIQSAGTALTLHAARHVVFAETAWTPADNMQAAKRFHRIGQKGAVLVDMPYIAGSIDERVTEVCRRKAADIAKVMESEI